MFSHHFSVLVKQLYHYSAVSLFVCSHTSIS